jgi:hypothetical protein
MGLKSLIKGKKVVDYADDVAGDIKGLRRSGVDLQKTAIQAMGGTDVGQMARAEAARESDLIRGAGEDAAQKTNQLISQRGLGNSSIGLGQQVQNTRQTANAINANNADMGNRIRRIANENVALGSNLIAQAGPLRLNTTKRREGGLGGALGTAIGAAVGGPAGAKIGGSIGGALQNS